MNRGWAASTASMRRGWLNPDFTTAFSCRRRVVKLQDGVLIAFPD
jgi:hypothetical protein